MKTISEALKAYIDCHPFDPGDSGYETVLDQLYQAYAESHESDPPEIQAGFAELETFLETLPLDDNNAVFNLCCRLYAAKNPVLQGPLEQNLSGFLLSKKALHYTLKKTAFCTPLSLIKFLFRHPAPKKQNKKAGRKRKRAQLPSFVHARIF